MFENLTEAIKKPFLSKPDTISTPSNKTDSIHVVKTVSDDDFEGVMVFSNLDSTDWKYGSGEVSQLLYQSKIIEMYRKLSKNSDINYAIDMLVNEMSFNLDGDIFKINIDEENNTIKEAIGDAFDDVLLLMNTNENIHSICRQLYIDGQLNVALTYDKDITEGIKKIQILEPFGLYFDKDNSQWKYSSEIDTQQNSLYVPEPDIDETYTPDELIHIDYGINTKIDLGEGTTGRINLGYLENAFKAANQLDTLENMLVPFRYNRSVSRRMFNIDVADLPPKKAKELMDKIRSEFKYKKTFDTETGTINNMQSTQPLVEDYWMSNRSGSRGTTVDTIDEKGALMDLTDIIYNTKKLFTSLKIPSNRNPYADDNGGSFSYDNTETTNEEMSYYLHVDKLRTPIIKLFKGLLKREIISRNIMTESEWKKYERKIDIEFQSKSIFLENMQKDIFIKSIGNFQEIKAEIGVLISLETAVGVTFGWSNEQLAEEMNKIKSERNNPLYKAFYDAKEDSGF